ncbi:hypothetical protein QBC33DRAFT_519732 [Phialemonium atrogriseum]|uniref:Uncharacterized protein n=1 Tax=Phialemonium atrogriseum TaxID=1093897 RepID=A0AAJ0BRW9_9PEZI|nr:uncharacterized protein QBC33DRAFT_519732 [Phialemonium atrogriseum]KAK1762273.1 hypothetical protein QBC33DRAFT_519732 [Phialemonium atrogriseum]
MDALKNLVTNIPDWLKRLDELNGQIEQRQQELSQVTDRSSGASGGDSRPARSMKNRGSTESLKPRDEPEAHPGGPPPPLQNPAAPTSNPLDTSAAAGTQQQTTPSDAQPPSSPAGSNTPSALQRQTNQVKAAGQARARATLRKRQRTESVISAEGATPKYRTRSMIIVYYDSYVQSFFEELVKFVSASRNMMRKAKMAAKVAQIKRLAELEMPDEDEDEDGQEDQIYTVGTAAKGMRVDRPDAPAAGHAGGGAPQMSTTIAPEAPLEASLIPEGDDEDGAAELPALRYVSTRRMQTISRQPNVPMTATGRQLHAPGTKSGFGSRGSYGAADQGRDVYDELDKGLEHVQGTCEHAAHQFLRDGDCTDEVTKIQRWLGETKELAVKEMERAQKEGRDAQKASEDPMKGRSFRPPNMRRDHAGSSSAKEASNELEVDEAIDDMDEEMTMPKLVYKSTRMMR